MRREKNHEERIRVEIKGGGLDCELEVRVTEWLKKKKNHLFFWQNASFSKVGLDSERFEETQIQRCLLGAAEARIQGTLMTNRGAIFLVPPVGWTLDSRELI